MSETRRALRGLLAGPEILIAPGAMTASPCG